LVTVAWGTPIHSSQAESFSSQSGRQSFVVVVWAGAETATNITEPSPHNGQPGSVSASGTVNITNLTGDTLNGQYVNVNFSKFEGGSWVYKNTDQVTIVNGSYSVSNWTVGVGNWRMKAVFPTQGANNRLHESETGWHEFTINPSGCKTETFITPGTPINGQPGFISASGTVQVPNPECGIVNGQYVNVNFAKKEGGVYVYKNTAQQTVVNGSYSVTNWTVGTGEWRVRAVFPAQAWFKESESGDHLFTVSPNGWHIDNLGGKLGSFDRLEKELADGESWSRFDRGIDGSAFFGSRAA